jgi:predicted esterase
MYALLVVAAVLTAQPRGGPQTLQFRSDVDGTDQPYSLYLPAKFDPGRKYPLVVSLPAEFSNSRLSLRRVFGRGAQAGEPEAEASRYFPRLPDVDFIVVSPSARGAMGYRGIAEKDLLDLVAEIRQRYPVDEDRVYLTGISMGGGGALWLGLSRPDVWAAIAAVCPPGPEEWSELAGNARNVPVRLDHGAQDPVAPVAGSREWRRRLAEADVRVDYREYPDARHNAWDPAYRDAGIFQWFSAMKRERHPRRVQFATRQYKYSTAYWLEITGMTPGELARVDASIVGRNRIAVRTNGVLGFRLRLDGHPLYAPGQWLTVVVDGVTLRTRQLAFRRGSEGWTAGAYARGPREKGVGAEGPLAEVVSARHIYVYGTRDNPGPEEESRRRQQAAFAAEWSTARIKMVARFRVAADRELTDADRQTSNLVLFGNQETNGEVARLAGDLPMHLDAGAADYGLFYVWPVGGRYVAVNSGLPFYAGSGRVRRAGVGLLSSPWMWMGTLGDYILFRATVENVVAEGRFDRNWRLTEESVRRLSSSSTVRLRP